MLDYKPLWVLPVFLSTVFGFICWSSGTLWLSNYLWVFRERNILLTRFDFSGFMIIHLYLGLLPVLLLLTMGNLRPCLWPKSLKKLLCFTSTRICYGFISHYYACFKNIFALLLMRGKSFCTVTFFFSFEVWS